MSTEEEGVGRGLPLNSNTETSRNTDKERHGDVRAVLSLPSQNVLWSPQGASGEATR